MSQPDPPLKYTPLQFAGTARLITICAGISVLLFVASSLMLWSIISDPSLLLYIELGKALVFAAILAALLLRCLRIKGHAASLREDLLLHHLIGLPAMGMAIVSTERQRVARCNDRLGEILGYSVDALLAKGWSELIHPEDAALDHADLERLLRGDSDGYCVEMRFVRNDGSTVIASSSASCLRSPSGEAEWLVYSLQDLSGLKENESRIVRLTRLYAALSHCNQAIVHSNGPEELYPKVCETAVLFGGMKMAWIGMADEDGRVRPVSAFGDGLDYLSALTVTTPVDDPSGQGPVGRAIRDNVPVWNQDFLQDPLALPWRAQAERFGWRSVAALPLHRDGAVIGAFALYSGEKDAFDETAQNLLIEMGCDIDYALDNFQREEIKRQMSKALRESEDRFRDLFQNAPLPYHSLDIEGNILEVNQRWLSILGYRRKDVIGRFFEDLVASESLTQYRISFAHFKERGSIEENYLELICKDGSRRQWVANGRIARDSEGNFLRTHCIFTDFTERKQIEGQLQLAGKVFEQSGEGIIVVDASYRIVMVNKAFTEITGYAAHEAIGQNPRMLGSGRHGTDFYMQMWDAIEKQGRWQGEVWNRKKSGDPYPEWLSISRVVDPEGKLTHYIGIFSDLTEHKAAQAHIHRLAHFDVLTGLPNRVLLGERSRLALSMAQRDLEPLALMFIDLDHFKNINDSLGHRIGDNLLVQFSRRMNDIVREQDTFSRLGGDEFILLLPSTNVKGAGQLAKKLLDAAQTPYLIDGHELSITCSIGIAMYPKDGRDFDSLSQSADMAMYRAKQIGRNNYSFFTADMQTHSVQTLEMENALRRALERDQLSLHYQPQISIADGNIVGVEALLRWKHPKLGMVSPSDFIPVAESNGLIIPIGEWVLRTAVCQMRAWLDKGYALPSMSVNLSPVQFRHPHLSELVMQTLSESDLAPHYLELELTEGAAMENPMAAIAVMDKLHDNGIRLSIDDFGIGHSSLGYLKRFRVCKLKIDRAFVRDIPYDADDTALVGAVISLASSMGLRTIAEGVENAEQLAFLSERGCNEIQGHYYSEALPADQMEALLRSLKQGVIAA